VHISKRHNKACPKKPCNCAGKWRARYPHPSPKPNRPTQQIERTFKHKKDAEAWLASQTTSLLTGQHIDPTSQRTTYQELAAARQATFHRLEPKTAAGYESILNNHLLPEFAFTRLSNLTPPGIESDLTTLSAQPHISQVRLATSSPPSVPLSTRPSASA
jgi:Phage integrase, N-terminal SAM-like domain